MPLVQPNQQYTYQDYLKWDDGERWELIGGVPYNMSHAPSLVHQDISMNLSRILSTKLLGKPCRPYAAPTDVVLSDSDVVQPDLLVVCDRNKMKEHRVIGAPDLVIEITNAASSKRDRWDKKTLYEKFGVKEYLLVDQDGKYVEQYLLDQEGHYTKGTAYSGVDVIPLQSLEAIELPLTEIFDLDIFEEEQN